MICPRCEADYKDGIDECHDCKVPLVENLPEPDHDLDLTPVLKTTNQPLLATFQALLHAAEIPHFVRGAEAASLMPVNAVVVVPALFVEAAQSLLDDVRSEDESS